MNIPNTICTNKPENKPGRTLIIQEPLSSNYLIDSVNVAISQSGTIFIEKENIQQAIELHEILKTQNIKCKFAYYRCFFSIDNIHHLKHYHYNIIKEAITNSIKWSYPNLKLIHFKLYRKNKEIKNAGYLVVDRIRDFNNIVGSKFHFTIHNHNFSVFIKKFINKKKY